MPVTVISPPARENESAARLLPSARLTVPSCMENVSAARELPLPRSSVPLCMRTVNPVPVAPVLRSAKPASMVREPPLKVRLLVVILSVVSSERGSKSASTVRDVPLSMVTLGSVHGGVAWMAQVPVAGPMTSKPATASVPKVFRKWQLRRIVR